MADITTGLQAINGLDEIASSQKNGDIVQPDRDIVQHTDLTLCSSTVQAIQHHCQENPHLLIPPCAYKESSGCSENPPLFPHHAQGQHKSAKGAPALRKHFVYFAECKQAFLQCKRKRRAIFPQLLHARGQPYEK